MLARLRPTLRIIGVRRSASSRRSGRVSTGESRIGVEVGVTAASHLQVLEQEVGLGVVPVGTGLRSHVLSVVGPAPAHHQASYRHLQGDIPT